MRRVGLIHVIESEVDMLSFMEKIKYSYRRLCNTQGCRTKNVIITVKYMKDIKSLKGVLKRFNEDNVITSVKLCRLRNLINKNNVIKMTFHY